MTVDIDRATQIVNFRKLRQDFASNALREGKNLYTKGVVRDAKVIEFGPKVIKVQAQVMGAYSNAYTCELEIDRMMSQILDSSCDCTQPCDCQHLACLIFHLEEELEKMVVGYSQAKDVPVHKDVDRVVREIEKKVQAKALREQEKLVHEEYTTSSDLLGSSAFFVPAEELNKDVGELAFVLVPTQNPAKASDVQLVLRLPFRTKPFYIQQPKQFFFSIQAQEPIFLAGRRLVFGIDSFGPFCEALIKVMRIHLHFSESKTEKGAVRSADLDREGLGEVLAAAYDFAEKHQEIKKGKESATFFLPSLFWSSSENPLMFAERHAEFLFTVDFFTDPRHQLFLNPSLNLGEKKRVELKNTWIFECSRPGVLMEGTYYRFGPEIKREHIHDLEAIHKMSIPQELFGTFVEYSLPELSRFARISNPEVLDDIVTFPPGDELHGECSLAYANGELEAKLYYLYGTTKIPDSPIEISPTHMQSFVTPDGIMARNLVAENNLVRDLFGGFIKDEKSGSYVAKNDRKIVEFMTEIIPKAQSKVQFHCPESLQSQFCYDDTRCTISLAEGKTIDKIELSFHVEGGLKGITVDYLWDCVSTGRTYIVIAKKGCKIAPDSENELSRASRILVLKLALLAPALTLFDELGIRRLEDFTQEIPLWTLVNLLPGRFENCMAALKLSPAVKEIQEQIFNMKQVEEVPLPKSLAADWRHYQIEGIGWLARLRKMHLNGILADDMGLGKTLQAITAMTQYQEAKKKGDPSLHLIVCPTSLVENWKEEFHHFGSKLVVVGCTGTPVERKKILAGAAKYDVLITSYGLIQKDIELYEKLNLGYLILDEAQAIKNRETRNARSVKKIPARHKLILTGTPLENSLDDLWSLFDFLMPGLLGSFDRFSNTYVKAAKSGTDTPLATLRKKVTPFVLRRMKVDVLDDLPPISNLVYNCRLSDVQRELYHSYAQSAREQLERLVAKEGFDKVRLQVLATLTRLKQICCHPAIFAKESAEPGDSAKYEMLLDLVASLVESKHKTVIFSQYTQMLAIMKQDIIKMGFRFTYLDGTSKNRLGIVKQFNEDPDIPLFLVSLKVGGTGLNLVGADTVIHYDMWWNPAVENQATDRVWRIGQKQAVSSYKLVTLDTIEEKIVAMQERKKGLLRDIVRSDDEVISKLTWEEVLELLKA
jgi:superfamily II DNA or RNA helicase